MNTKFKYYYCSDDNKYKKAKIRYFIYGGLILALAITLFILELFNGFEITRTLDYFISVAMFSDMIIGIIYIIKGILLKSRINSKTFNVTNSKIDNDKIISYAGVIRYLSIIPVLLNISIIIFYVLTIIYKNDKISFVMIFSFVIGILVNIGAIMAFFSIDNENQIYNRIEKEEVFSQNDAKNMWKMLTIST